MFADSARIASIETDDKERFARKVIRAFGGPARRKEIEDMMRNEARAITKLCGAGAHTNVVAVLRQGAVKDTGMFYFDMEYCNSNLENYMHEFKSRGKRLSMYRVWSIMQDVASGIAYIHQHGEVHRDLKPRNVLYSETAQCWKLADFGLTSQGTSRRLHTTAHSKGTDGYRAPELLQSDKATYNNKVDVWSMGCILYEMTVGQKAFDSDWALLQRQQSSAPIQMPIEVKVAPDIYQKLRFILPQMLEWDSSHRPSSHDLQKAISAQFERTAETTPIITSRILGPLGRSILAGVVCFGSTDLNMCAIAFRSTLSQLLPAFIKAKDDWPGEYVVVFDTLANMPVVRVCPSLGRISAMALSHRSPGRTLLAVNAKAFKPTESSGCHEIAVWDVTPGNEVSCLFSSPSSVSYTAFAFSADQNRLACGLSQGNVTLWDLSGLSESPPSPATEIATQSHSTSTDLVPGHSGILSLKYDSIGTRICALSQSGRLQIYNADDLSRLSSSLQVRPNKIVLHMSDNTVFMWDESGFWKLDTETKGVVGVVWSDNAMGSMIRDCSAMSFDGQWIVRTRQNRSGLYVLSRRSVDWFKVEIDPQYVWFSGRNCFVITKERLWTIDCDDDQISEIGAAIEKKEL